MPGRLELHERGEALFVEVGVPKVVLEGPRPLGVVQQAEVQVRADAGVDVV